MAGRSAEIQVPADPNGTKGPSGSGGRKLRILALMLTVMAVEGAGIYLLIPSSASNGASEEVARPGDEAASTVDHTVEVPIEPVINVTNSLAAPGSIVHVTFKLVAIVPREQQLAFEEAANVEHHARVRQAIVKVARSAGMDDLSDPALRTLKRLLREEMNKVLRKSYVNEIVISDFKTMEQ